MAIEDILTPEQKMGLRLAHSDLKNGAYPNRCPECDWTRQPCTINEILDSDDGLHERIVELEAEVAALKRRVAANATSRANVPIERFRIATRIETSIVRHEAVLHGMEEGKERRERRSYIRGMQHAVNIVNGVVK